MTIQQLKYFIEVVRTKNLTEAAKNLFITQPTLSLALKKIEAELTSPLFDHTANAYQLTDVGHYLYDNAVRLVNDYEQLQRDLQHMVDQKEKSSTRIRLGITTLFCMQYITAISAFLDRHPHVDLVIKQDGSPYLQELLVNKELDIGLISYPNLYPDILEYRSFNNEATGYHAYVVVPKSNPLSKCTSLTFMDLKNERFSALTDHYVLGRLVRDRAKVCGYTPNIVLNNDDLQVLLHSLERANSICILPIEYKAVGQSRGLKWIPLEDKYNFFPIGIAMRKDYPIFSELSDLIQMIGRHGNALKSHVPDN